MCSSDLHEKQSPFESLMRARHPGRLQMSFIAVAFVSLMMASLQLLGPLHLDAEGLSSAQIGWVFTTGSVLSVGAILTVAASQETVQAGILLLAVYSLGLGVPFLMTSLGVNRFLSFYARFRAHMRTLEITAGAIMIVLGVMIMTNQFTRLAGYLSFLNRFSL